MMHRLAWFTGAIALFGALGAGGAVLVACGSDAAVGPTPGQDAGHDGATSDAGCAGQPAECGGCCGGPSPSQVCQGGQWTCPVCNVKCAIDGGSDAGADSGHDSGAGDAGGFACGPSLTCSATQWCETAAGGAQPADGASNQTWGCNEPPADCASAPTCACITADGGGAGCTCNADGAGHVTVECLFP